MHAAPSSRTAVAHRHSQTSGSPAACGAVGRPAGPVPRRHSAAAPGPSVVAAAGGKASGSGAKQPAAAAAKKATQWVPPNGILKINPELLATGGLEVGREGPQAKGSFDGHLQGLFMPVNLDHPGLRVLNIDPPVLTVDEFMSPEECDAIVAAATASGLMKQSGVGVGGYQVKDADNVRTSSTLAATTEVLAQHADLSAALNVMLARARGLLQGPLPPADAGAAAFARPSTPGQISFELPQVARYQPGQHFLTHEDAFPPPVVGAKGYQRRATLLVYLNDCVEGGATKFDVLDIAVQPRKGKALLFFPAFSNGINDRRTLHTAQDAVAEKWVTQLWLSVGVRTTAAAQNGGLPAFVTGVKGVSAPEPRSRAGKRGVPPQRINTKI
ncbi:hypothetical protein CHLRE_08g379950v5 [Chlamydomonas reinhardtii]|uniref:Fe2OG dioxygenase domain-containing protein n=1 Tax=Chlamydomonas reinhardtii TaxID=3055 RepID=A0A2K3DHZ3_CHLRE|nr:uncharacterized protein CHLRE_08g379950v5 [Chlamydomonas reinhardtii]PNW80149.1 hypothetical protein CHLRE_08g379950v5 [Chlamydomonas reinhardtii]